MRRAFTLIELLVIIAIIGTMVTVSVLSVQSGREAAKMRGAARDVFAAIRQARSVALVSQKPCIITFSTKASDGTAVSKVEITSAELVKETATTYARSLDGRWRTLGQDAADDGGYGSRRDAADAGEAAPADGGHTAEEMLFQSISEDVLEGICIKVVMDDEDVDARPGEVNEAKRSMISTFSNVDFLLGTYRDERKKQKDAEAAESAGEASGGKGAAAGSAAAAPAAGIEEEEKSLAWQVNGRCDPHTVYVYAEGADWRRDAWRIKVDRFGAARILEGDDE